MLHEMPLIATIVAGLGLAFIFGALANRLKMPPLVGYLLAGVLVGPHTPGFVADQALAPELAELGVILLMFGVGLHFSLKDLLSVRAIAVPGAIAQMTVATLLGVALAWTLGWSMGAGLVFGLALSVASTVVLLRALQERRLIDSEKGRIAVGWLIVEDLAMVLALVLIPATATLLGGDASLAHADPIATRFGLDLWGVIGLTLVKVAAFVAIMLVVGRRLIPWILHYVAHTGSRELFRLAVLAIALGVAYGAAQLFGVSLALGAFFAGMIMSESELSHRAAEESLPLRDAFSVLFFVSVGMLFDPNSIIVNSLPIIATVLIIVVGKSVAAYMIVRAFGYSSSTALIISASLAQIGEFSFILAELGVGLAILPEEARDLILAGAILSIVLNPLVFFLIDRLAPRLEQPRPAPRTVESAPAEDGDPAPAQDTIEPVDLDSAPPVSALSGHAVLVGYGRVGKVVAEALKQAGTPFLVIEDADKSVERARADGIEVIGGNAARQDILAAANLAAANSIVIAIPNAIEAGPIVTRARASNPALTIVARAHADAEVDHLLSLGATHAVMGERELARGLVARVLEDAMPRAEAAEAAEAGTAAPAPAETPATADVAVAADAPPAVEPGKPEDKA